MKYRRTTEVLLTLAVLACAPSVLAQAPATQPAPAAPGSTSTDVPVTHVVLFSSGVGYFEHSGSVTGNATSDLPFQTAQINDVLKSLIVYDKDGGTVRTITYPANDPVGRTLRSFQVNLSDDPPLADILRQIRGTKVSIAIADETVAGDVLGVEETERLVGKAGEEKVIQTPQVNLITDGGIRSIALTDIRKLDILDDKIRKEMSQQARGSRAGSGSIQKDRHDPLRWQRPAPRRHGLSRGNTGLENQLPPSASRPQGREQRRSPGLGDRRKSDGQ